MKRFLLLASVLVILIAVLVGCNDSSSINFERVNVTFCVDGEVYQTKSISRGNTVSEMVAPEKENEIFIGWFLDKNLSVRYDFSKKVYLSTTLYAGYVMDTVAVTDMVAESIMRGVVTVHNKCYNTGLGGLVETSSSSSQGSGAIIDISGGWCYVLTNHHVVEKLGEYSRQKITVEDAWGNIYEAQIYKNDLKAQAALDPSYDLAVICFKYTNTENHSLYEIELASDPAISENIISLGTPKGQKNTFTCGKVLTYSKLSNSSDESISALAFDIIVHDANINRGSSGGPLINSKGQLVGLNFAGYDDRTYAFAIPVSKINEFLNVYVYN